MRALCSAVCTQNEPAWAWPQHLFSFTRAAGINYHKLGDLERPKFASYISRTWESAIKTGSCLPFAFSSICGPPAFLSPCPFLPSHLPSLMLLLASYRDTWEHTRHTQIILLFQDLYCPNSKVPFVTWGSIRVWGT